MSDTDTPSDVQSNRSTLGGCTTFVVAILVVGWLFGDAGNNDNSESAEEAGPPPCEHIEGRYVGEYEARTPFNWEINPITIRIRPSCQYTMVMDSGSPSEGEAEYSGDGLLTMEPNIGATIEADLVDGRLTWYERGDNYEVAYDLRQR